MDWGKCIDRIELSPRLGWLLRSKVRALAVHERGLVIETGGSAALVPWTDVQTVIGGVGEMTSRAGSPVRAGHTEYVIACLGRPEIKMRARGTRPDYRRIAELIAARANLEWFHGSVGGRALPPMAVKPEAAANLRASLK